MSENDNRLTPHHRRHKVQISASPTCTYGIATFSLTIQTLTHSHLHNYKKKKNVYKKNWIISACAWKQTWPIRRRVSYLGYFLAQDTEGTCIEGRIPPMSSGRPLSRAGLWAFSRDPSLFQSDSSPLDSGLFWEVYLDWISVFTGWRIKNMNG